MKTCDLTQLGLDFLTVSAGMFLFFMVFGEYTAIKLLLIPAVAGMIVLLFSVTRKDSC
ncbi:MAG: hypothetical protein ABIG20_00125 [archaeon]